MVPGRVRVELDEPQECCVWLWNSELHAQNGLVCCHDGADKILLPTDPVVCITQHHKGGEAPPGSTPFWWFGLVVRTHDVPLHGNQRKRQHDLDIAVDLPCFFRPRGCRMFPQWRLHLRFCVVPINQCMPVTRVFRKLGSLFALSSMSYAMSRWHCFCSIVTSFGMNLADTLLMSKLNVPI